MIQRFIIALVASAVLILPVYGERLYRTVDEEGNVSYQSKPSYDGGGSIEERDISSDEVPDDPAIVLDRAILEFPVTIYSTEKCKTCEVIRQQLKKREIPFEEKFPAQDLVVFNELQEVSGGTSVPVIVVGEKVITKYSYLVLKQALNKAGYPKVGAIKDDEF